MWLRLSTLHASLPHSVVVVESFRHVRLFVTPWTVAHQASLSMGFPRQEHWSGLPFPSSGDLTDPGIEPASPALAGRLFTAEPLGKPYRDLSHSNLCDNVGPSMVLLSAFYGWIN